MFPGTIKYNLMYSRLVAGLPPASQEEMEWACNQVMRWTPYVSANSGGADNPFVAFAVKMSRAH
jgi:hypothetical protein